MKVIARFWAGFDLLLTGLLAFPPTASLFIDLTYRLSGDPALYFVPIHLLFVCLAGTLGVVWAGARLYDPRRDLVIADILGRTWVAALLGWFLATQSVPKSLFVFVASEVVGAIHQTITLRRFTRSPRTAGS